MASEEEVRHALSAVRYPGFRRDIVTLGVVRNVAIHGSQVVVVLAPGTRRREVAEAIAREVEGRVSELPGVAGVEVVIRTEADEGRVANGSGIPGVRHLIAVASTKGGVGKSTVAVNLALALAEHGRVGLLDADVYGPSLPLMLGASGPPGVSGGRLRPVECHGIGLMSLGFFLDERSPVIWRGPLVMALVRQFLHDVAWGETDYLVVDLPPGTGDAPLTLVQQVRLSGAVVVTTPQDVALLDVGRGVAMLEQLNAPLLGVIVNMTSYRCPHCGTQDPLFGGDDARAVAGRLGTRLLAELPLVPAFREAGDRGLPLFVSSPEHPLSRSFRQAAGQVIAEIEAGGAGGGGAG